MSILLQSFQQQTIIWILISAGLGGIIGALIEFIFKQILTRKVEAERQAKDALQKYSYPLLRAADDLNKRIENFIDFADKSWFEDQNDDYYRISTLYIFGQYFGLCKILEDKSFLKYELSNKRARKFGLLFYNVFKALTGFHYFQGLEKDKLSLIRKASIPRLVLTAIGELMINTKKEKSDDISIINFVEFTQAYSTQPEFKKWFSYIEGLFIGLNKSQSDLRWNRLIILTVNLRILVEFLASKRRVPLIRKLYSLEEILPSARTELIKEIDEVGYSHVIASGNIKKRAS